MFFYALGDGKADEIGLQNNSKFKAFYITFVAIFYFILTKTLISIVIIRYRLLRSLRQLNNEAKARIVNAKTKEILNVIKNLILCRRRDRLLVDRVLNSNSDNKENEHQDLNNERWITVKLN